MSYLEGLFAICRDPVSSGGKKNGNIDWMGYVGNLSECLHAHSLLLHAKVYQYNQQMGITLMGGFLAFILQAMPRSQLLFLDGNYNPWV